MKSGISPHKTDIHKGKFCKEHFRAGLFVGGFIHCMVWNVGSVPLVSIHPSEVFGGLSHRKSFLKFLHLCVIHQKLAESMEFSMSVSIVAQL